MKRLLSLSVCLLTAMLSFAYDFEVGGIYYNVTSSNAPLTVEVTHEGSSYSDDVIIPKTVTYEDETYGVTSIGSKAFYECSNLTSVNIPNSVTNIGDNAFEGCTGLTSVIIPNSVTTIGGSAFEGCTGLTSVIIPNSVTTIGGSAFSGCSGLTSVVIPGSVTTIGGYAFDGCISLTKVIVPDIAAWCKITFVNASNPLSTAKHIYSDENNEITDLVIPNSVTSIGDCAFWGCASLTSVTIPNSVTTIGIDAFMFCEGLTSVTIPNSVTTIGAGAFTGCTGLTSVTIPNSVTTIGGDAFLGCSGLTSVIIPNSVTTIDNEVFAGCSGLTSVTIPNSVTSIGERGFSGCSSLTSVTIPNSVTTIGVDAFSHCSALTTITIPNSVTSIGEYAFYGCKGLTEIVSYIQEPFALNPNCWYKVSNTIPVYVPAGTKEKYQNTVGWKSFHNFIEFGTKSIEPAEATQEVKMTLLPKQIDLDGVVIGDTYYNIDTENGDKFDAENGCIVLKTATTDEDVQAVSGLPISDDRVKAALKGIIFMVPAGSGKVYVNAETVGSKALMIKAGNQEALSFQPNDRETVEMSYTVAEPSYIYIFASDTETTQARGSRKAEVNESCVKVYSYKWESAQPSGIESITISPNADIYYSIDGRKLCGKPAQRGIYIVNGRKVAVK